MYYEPSARRPIADLFRLTAHGATRLCVRLNIHPDVISYTSLGVAAMAAIAFWLAQDNLWLLLVGIVLCVLRLWCCMLDGMVALESGKASKRGEIVNEVPDRLSDVLIFVGIAHSGLCNPFIGYWAAIASLFAAYIGIFGQSLNVRREYAGIMPKPIRMLVLMIAALIYFFLTTLEIPTSWGSWTVLDIGCVIVIVGCIQTIWARLGRTLRGLSEQ